MNLINIYEPKAVIVIEKFADNTIKQSSNLFCGACGRICAIVQNDLEFDFRFSDLKKNSNSFFLFENEEGVSCSRCQSHLFDGESSISFATLEQFEEFQAGAFGRKMSAQMKDSEENSLHSEKLVDWENKKEKVDDADNIFKIARDREENKPVIEIPKIETVKGTPEELHNSDFAIETDELNKISAKVFQLKPKNK